jgi:phosphoserine phosphatase
MSFAPFAFVLSTESIDVLSELRLSTRLTTAEFHARVHALNPRVAVFDCDGTLWSGDAGSTFMRYTMGLMDAPPLLSPSQIDWMQRRYDGYKAGTVSELAICGEMVQVYAGIPIADLRASAAAFFRTHVEPNIFPEMLALVTELQANGCDIWADSSTNDWVIEEGVQRFHIPANRVLSARVAAADGLATDTLIDVPTDEGKVTSLHNAGIITPDAVFGNSVHDAAMLAIAGAGGAFPVNPTQALVQRAAAEGWPIYFPASVAP